MSALPRKPSIEDFKIKSSRGLSLPTYKRSLIIYLEWRAAASSAFSSLSRASALESW